MLYQLLYPLHHAFGAFRVFRYISFRVFMAILTSLAISFLLGPTLIRFLKKKQIGQQVRDDGPKSHLSKSGTPTMGGILIVFSLLLSFLLWTRLDMALPWIVMLATVSFASIGFIDDYAKITKKQSKGLTAAGKFRLQMLIGLVVASLLVWSGFSTELHLPIFKEAVLNLHWILFIPFAAIVIIGSSNAVNLTDGLDGLAIGPVMVAAFAYLIISYVTGHFELSQYLQIAHVKGAGELAIFCGALMGAGLGFLWFNTYPAQVFMGDVGSLSLGAALGTVAVMSKQEILLILVGAFLFWRL